MIVIYRKEAKIVDVKNLEHKPVVAFDFDAVISTYNGWKGQDVFGETILDTIELMGHLQDEGYFITIFTTRLASPKLLQWLKDNNVRYDSINSTSHNPPYTSIKPVFEVFIDDRAINFHGQSAGELEQEIQDLINTKHEIEKK